MSLNNNPESQSSKISRREFLQWAALAGVSLGVLGGCGSAPSARPSETMANQPLPQVLLDQIEYNKKHYAENPDEANFGKMAEAVKYKPVVSPDGEMVAILVKPSEIGLSTIDRFYKDNKHDLVDKQGKITYHCRKKIHHDRFGNWAGWKGGKVEKFGWTQARTADNTANQVIQFSGITHEGKPFTAWALSKLEPEANRMGISCYRIYVYGIQETEFGDKLTTIRGNPGEVQNELIDQVALYAQDKPFVAQM